MSLSSAQGQCLVKILRERRVLEMVFLKSASRWTSGPTRPISHGLGATGRSPGGAFWAEGREKGSPRRIAMSDGKSGLQLRSLLKKSGELELSLVDVPTPEPADDEVVVRVEATPINPSDLGLLIGPADMSTATGRHVDRQGFRQHGRARGHGEDAGSGAADDGGAARSVAPRGQ
jgi:hypothetical protein